MKNKIIAAIASLAAFASFAGYVHANPGYFVPTVQTATATTSISYMTPGTATTTLQYDTYNTGNNYATNYATLLARFAASSTPTFAINLEYSQDGIDWYGNTLFNNSTTTAAYSLNVTNSYTFSPAASSTLRAIKIDTPTRFVRANLSVAGSNGGVWAQFVPNKERPE